MGHKSIYHRLYLMLVIISLVSISVQVNSYSGLAISDEADPISVIIDTDVGQDDILAILYLIQEPSVSVKAITVSAGVSYVESGVNNILNMLDYLGIDDIPVAGGQDKSLNVNHTFPPNWRDGSNNFYGVNIPNTDMQAAELNASELIVSKIENYPYNYTIVALGPLTNIAQALISEPLIKTRIDSIHMMGGAVNVDGNVGHEYPAIPNFAAEWNFYVDPHAADIVFKSEIPISLVPLDATNDVPQTQEFLLEFQEANQTLFADFAIKFMNPGLYFWDPLTVVALVNPNVVTWEDYFIEIELELNNHEGQTISKDGMGSNAKVATSGNRELFEDTYIHVLNLNEVIISDTESSNTKESAVIGLIPLIAILFYIQRHSRVRILSKNSK